MISVRPAGTLDAREMAELLNAIIRKGGTTAHTEEVSRETLLEWMSFAPDQSAWHVAESDDGKLLGLQFIEPHNKLPAVACDIATFVEVGQTGLGIGSKLFDATRQAASKLGYTWINATIRADNEGGLAYYQSRGFEDYARDTNVPLGDGQMVDRLSKMFRLE